MGLRLAVIFTRLPPPLHGYTYRLTNVPISQRCYFDLSVKWRLSLHVGTGSAVQVSSVGAANVRVVAGDDLTVTGKLDTGDRMTVDYPVSRPASQLPNRISGSGSRRD